MIENKLRISMLFLGPFPIGNVSTLRIMSYCKALAKNGHNVKVYIIAPTKEAEVNENKKGIIDDVQYEYVTKITWDKENTPIFAKILYYFIGILKTIFLLKRDKTDIILSYHNELLFNFVVRSYSTIFKKIFIIDKTEYPANYFSKSKFGKWCENIKLKLFNGIITISVELEKFYSNIISKERTFLLPMTVDIDRYKNVSDNNTEAYIAVMFGTHNRDNIIDSIYAYKKYLELNPESSWKLYLIGDFDGLCKTFPENYKINDFIEQENLKDRIIFKGLVINTEIPFILKNAICLLMTPLGFVSGGFPTKLGEYLLSGKPVVSTKVGELSNYLKDKENIFFAEAGDIDTLAQNLLFIDIKNAEANIIGKNGLIVAKKFFNAENYIEELVGFFKILKKNA